MCIKDFRIYFELKKEAEHIVRKNVKIVKQHSTKDLKNQTKTLKVDWNMCWYPLYGT